MKNTQINNDKRNETKLIVLVRADITPGYQLVQSTHSVADFAAEHYNTFIQWKQESNSIICLSVPDEKSLIKLYNKLKIRTEASLFFEPDVDSYTSVCLYGTPQIRKKLSYLPLALKSKEEKTREYSSAVERGTLNSKVVGSNPTTPSNNNAMCVTKIGNSDHKPERCMETTSEVNFE